MTKLCWCRRQGCCWCPGCDCHRGGEDWGEFWFGIYAGALVIVAFIVLMLWA